MHFKKKTRLRMKFCLKCYIWGAWFSGSHSACPGAVSGWFEALSTHHCWALSKFFVASFISFSGMVSDKNSAFGGNGEQSDLCGLEQVTFKPQLQVDRCLTSWLQIWYLSLLRGDSATTPRN